MRTKYLFALALAGGLSLPSPAAAQQPQFWQPTLETARRVAAQTNRLVLIYFVADWCQVCRTMEQELLSQPNVMANLQANFVPVRVNADYFPATAKQYGIVGLPTTVVTTPDGVPLETLRGRYDVAEYASRLGSVAAAVRRQGPAVVAAVAGNAAPAGPPASSMAPPVAVDPPQAISPPPADRYADYYNGRQPARGNPPASLPSGPAPNAPAASNSGPQVPPPSAAAATALPPAAAAGSDNSPLGLEGYCPVALAEKQQWVPGDRRWGARHRGRTYLFSGPQERDRFFADPDRFAPMISGNDVVLAVEQGQLVPGYRQHGVFFGNRVYLFADETSLQKFSQNPSHYANEALQAMRAGTLASQQQMR